MEREEKETGKGNVAPGHKCPGFVLSVLTLKGRGNASSQ